MNGGLAIKATPNMHIIIFKHDLNVNFSVLKKNTAINVVHNGLVFYKTIASDKLTNFIDINHNVAPMLPNNPLIKSFLIMLYYLG